MKRTFFNSNSSMFRALRTLTQYIIGALIANVDILLTGIDFTPTAKVIITLIVMCILSPIYKLLGGAELDEAFLNAEMSNDFGDEWDEDIDGEDDIGDE